MGYTDIANVNMLAALALGFSLGGFFVTFLQLALFARGRGRRSAPPISPHACGGGPSLQVSQAKPARGSGAQGNEIGPDRLRELLEQDPGNGHHDSGRRVPGNPSHGIALDQEREATHSASPCS